MSRADDYTLPLAYPFTPTGQLGAPPPAIAWARKHAPVCPVVLPSGTQVWMITRKDDISAVFTDPAFSRDLVRPGSPRFVGEDFTAVPGGIFNLDGADHSRVQQVLAPYYTRAAAARHAPMIARHAGELLDAMAAGPNPVDLVEAYAGPLPLLVSCEILGVPVRLRADYLDAFRTQASLDVTAEDVAEATAATMDLTARIISGKRAEPGGPGPVGALIEAEADGRISEEELHGTVCYLLVTGSEPLVPPLSTGPVTLMCHRNQLQECVDDETLWPAAVEEVLRYHHNGILGLPRVALEDVTLHGVRIRRGDGVCAPMLGATWDPRHYHNPEKFNIHRKEDANATFGAGPHYCLGSALARVFLVQAYTALFRRFPGLFLAVSEEDLPWQDGLVLCRPAKVPVCW
ncbi:cytochrome P450 [Streptomyces sp. CRN 30]|uniref:cytochrome P450 n=1 Tax=Streptomyces sp. CRN 30 TaxID=3075613 RepID=UPI002A80DB41|nr:cytochrome P450 [Streptomyces sp. CRN 30]